MSLLVKGVTNFLALTDTPAAYTDQAEKMVNVKATEDGVEFSTPGKFSKTKVFDGSVASPPTINYVPYTTVPYYDFNPGKGLYRFFAVVVGDYIYVGGGASPAGVVQYTNKFFRFNIVTEKWQRLANLPVNGNTFYENSCAGYYNGKIYFACSFENAGFYKKILEYTIATNSWSVVADFPTFGGLDELILVACSDALYLHQSNNAMANRFDKMDYSTYAWTSLTGLVTDATTLRAQIGGKIGDDIYLVGVIGTGYTFKYDKGGDTWTNQEQNAPFSMNCGACYVEDADELWIRSFVEDSACYKYTTAGGWVQQYTQARATLPWGWAVQPSGMEGFYGIWGRAILYNAGQTEGIWSGSIQEYRTGGIWELLTQDFDQGDLMVMNVTSGVPVNVEKGGILRFISMGLDTVYVVEAGTYYFTLDKDYEFKGVEIYRSVWG